LLYPLCSGLLLAAGYDAGCEKQTGADASKKVKPKQSHPKPPGSAALLTEAIRRLETHVVEGTKVP
jgi:hypothetical protein